MNPLDRQWFYRGFLKKMKETMPDTKAEIIWEDAGREYERILKENPGIRKHPGAMVIPAVALYRTLQKAGIDAEGMLNEYGTEMGRTFARLVHAVTSIPGADRLIANHAASIGQMMSSEKLGYQRRIVSEEGTLFGVDITSCPYHELARQLGDEKAVLCICHMDKEYSQGFHHIRYERSSAVSEGAECCAYRLTFDPAKE